MTILLEHQPPVRLFFESLDSSGSEILDLIRKLVETESPSGDVEGSKAVVDILVDEAGHLDCVTSIERIPSPDCGEHLLIRAFDEFSSVVEPSPLLLLGHTDTVHPRGSIKELSWREEGGKIYGPGIFDMKANCALALWALSTCYACRGWPKRPVTLLLTCDEEIGSATGRALVEKEARGAAQVLVLEPPAPGQRVKTARKGTGMYTLAASGRAAHAGLEPEKGASAILEIARQIEQLHRLNDPASGISVNVGVVSGGTRSNVVAAEAHAEIDVRFCTNADAEYLNREIKNLKPFDERVSLAVKGGINRPPLERTNNVAMLYEHAKRVAGALGFELGEASVGGASDGNFAAAVGATVLDGLGVDGDGAHSDHEHIIAADLPRRGALLAGLIASL